MTETDEMIKNDESLDYIPGWTAKEEIRILDEIINDKTLIKQLIALGLSAVPTKNKPMLENYVRVAIKELSDLDDLIKRFENRKAAITETSNE